MNKNIAKTKDDYPSYCIDLVVDSSFEQIVADGYYNSISYGISAKRFLLRGREEENLRIYLIDLDEEEKESERIIVEAKKIGLYPAGSEELLALGTQYPKLQDEHPIIALDSMINIEGHLRLLGLYQNSDERRLVLDWYLGLWPVDYRFAFVSKERS